MLHMGQNSCKRFNCTGKRGGGGGGGGGRALLLFAEGIFTPSYELRFASSCRCFTWARTAANASAAKAREGAEHCCYLQKGYLHQATNSHLLAAANASRGPEQLQMLQMIGDRARYLHQVTNSQSEQLVALGKNSCKWGQYNVRAPLLVYAVWRGAVSFFSTKEQVYIER